MVRRRVAAAVVVKKLQRETLSGSVAPEAPGLRGAVGGGAAAARPGRPARRPPRHAPPPHALQWKRQRSVGPSVTQQDRLGAGPALAGGVHDVRGRWGWGSSSPSTKGSVRRPPQHAPPHALQSEWSGALYKAPRSTCRLDAWPALSDDSVQILRRSSGCGSSSTSRKDCAASSTACSTTTCSAIRQTWGKQ